MSATKKLTQLPVTAICGNASVAACLIILSYMVTAVISASEAMHYLHNLFISNHVFFATIILLTLFLLRYIRKLSEQQFVYFTKSDDTISPNCMAYG